MSEVQSYKTAIGREGNMLSLPMRHLYERGFLKGRVLDYGCGLGEDADMLGIDGYDPYWRKLKPRGKFDTIICNYVLNVLRLKRDRDEVVGRIRALLRRGGKAYISVRRDIKGCYKTPDGWQVNVRDVPGGISIRKEKGYEIYVILG